MKAFSLIQSISTKQGFLDRYMYHLYEHETQLAAYEATESEHIAIFNRRKYSGYDSFRKVKNRNTKK